MSAEEDSLGHAPTVNLRDSDELFIRPETSAEHHFYNTEAESALRRHIAQLPAGSQVTVGYNNCLSKHRLVTVGKRFNGPTTTIDKLPSVRKQTRDSPSSRDARKSYIARLDRLISNMGDTGITPSDTSDLQPAMEPLAPVPEPDSYAVKNEPFAFSPGHLNKLLNPKSLPAFLALGGIDGIAKGLQTDLRTGLCDTDVDFSTGAVSWESAAGIMGNPEPGRTGVGDFHRRKKVYGENRLPPPDGKPLFKLMWEAYNDKVLILLTAAAAISLALGLYQTFTAHDGGTPNFEWVEGVAIMVAVLVVVAVSALNGWHKERQFQKLKCKKEDRMVKVIRSGKTESISVHDVLVGDVLHLEPGDLIPADGIFIEGFNVKCDESSATGESDIMRKATGQEVFSRLSEGTCGENRGLSRLDPFIISGSKVVEGVGTFLVTAVGSNSSLGQTMLSLRHDVYSDTASQSPLWMDVLSWWLELNASLVDGLIVLMGLFCRGIASLLNVWYEIEYRLSTSLVVPIIESMRLYFERLLVNPDSDVDTLDSPLSRHRTSHATRHLYNRRTSYGLSDELVSSFWNGPVVKLHGPSTSPSWRGNRNHASSTRLDSLKSNRISINRKLAMGLILAGYGIPMTVAALTLARGLRIASGATSAISGVTVIPLRTTEGFPVWSWILTYGVWATAFSVYLWLQTRRIPPEVNHRRQLYLFCVIMAAVHFTIALSQSSPSIPDAFTLYSPILLTASAYLMSLLLKAVFPRGPIIAAVAPPPPINNNPDANAAGAQPDQAALALGAVAMGGAPPEAALLFQRGNQN